MKRRKWLRKERFRKERQQKAFAAMMDALFAYAANRYSLTGLSASSAASSSQGGINNPVGA